MWYQHVMVIVVTALSCRVSRARRFEPDFAMRMVPLGEGQMKAADNQGRRTISAIQVCEVYILQSLSMLHCSYQVLERSYTYCYGMKVQLQVHQRLMKDVLIYVLVHDLSLRRPELGRHSLISLKHVRNSTVVMID
jgi:hypothetical protein